MYEMFCVDGHVRYLRIELSSEFHVSLFVRLKNDGCQISRHLWRNLLKIRKKRSGISVAISKKQF